MKSEKRKMQNEQWQTPRRTPSPRFSFFIFRFLFFILATCFLGCRSSEPPLPKYEWHGSDNAIKILSARAKSVKTVQATSLLILTNEKGDSVRLDGAVAMAPPDRVRLRAWKFNQAVFDLTLTPDGLWILTPDNESRKEKIMPASLSAAQFAKSWAGFTGEFFDDPKLAVIDGGGASFRLRKSLDDNAGEILCDVDRATLTPRRYAYVDAAGKSVFTLTLGMYRQINGIAWPTELLAKSPRGEIEIELDEVEINAELPPDAFKPPRRAEKQP